MSPRARAARFALIVAAIGGSGLASACSDIGEDASPHPTTSTIAPIRAVPGPKPASPSTIAPVAPRTIRPVVPVTIAAP